MVFFMSSMWSSGEDRILRIANRLSGWPLCSLVNGCTPADECNLVSGGEIRACRNCHRPALRQRPCRPPLSKLQRRIITRLPSDIAFRTLQPFCESRTIPTQPLPNSSAPSFRSPVHLTAPKYLSPLDLAMIWR